jgi:hypothetical protein
MRSAGSLFAAMSLLTVAVPCGALEKTSVRLTDGDRDTGWARCTSVAVTYYNTCTDWLWVWSGWSAGDIIGTCYEFSCYHQFTMLDASAMYFAHVMPSGYGFTGTIAVHAADANGCPAGALASAPLLPVYGWNLKIWNLVVPARFVVTYEFGPASDPDSILIHVSPASDHPAPGPTGPQACGFCYPWDRLGRSFYYGSAESPLCPGSTLFDGVCDANWLAEAYVRCPKLSVDKSSWGSIKSLYR